MNDETTGALSHAAFDRERLAQLVRVAIGSKKIKTVMEETGLSRSTISKLLNANAVSLPSSDTLLKLTGGTPSPLFWQMVEACGTTREQQQQLRNLQMLADNFTPVPQPKSFRWSSHHALCAVLRSLEQGGYGADFQIDYRSEGIFAVDMGEQYPLLTCIPVVTDGQDSSQVLSLARNGLADAFTRWDLSDSLFFLLTDSQPVFELLQQLPNPTVRLAVALVGEDGMTFRAQQEIRPLIPAYAAETEFPVNLTKTTF